jgi:hypothetical protein
MAHASRTEKKSGRGALTWLIWLAIVAAALGFAIYDTSGWFVGLTGFFFVIGLLLIIIDIPGMMQRASKAGLFAFFGACIVVPIILLWVVRLVARYGIDIPAIQIPPFV